MHSAVAAPEGHSDPPAGLFTVVQAMEDTVCPLVLAEKVPLGFALPAPAGPGFWDSPALFEGGDLMPSFTGTITSCLKGGLPLQGTC